MTWRDEAGTAPTAPPPRVILVEDDADLRESIEEYLKLTGFTTVGVGTALEFFQTLATTEIDVAVIDVGLPDQEGFEIAALLRQRREIGVVMLTARGASEDRIKGFQSGADLYFVKPVDCRELAAALLNLVGRLPQRALPTTAGVGSGATDRAAPAEDHAAGEWVLDRVGWSFRAPGGREIQVTSFEMRLLDAMILEPGTTVARGTLLTALGYREDDSGRRSLDVLVSRLRRKIEATVGGKAPIQTMHNRGYLFSARVRKV
jgi:two-component system OmpR family response regulator